MPLRKFSLPSIIPPVENVLGRLGYNRKKSSLDENTLSLVKTVIENSIPLIKPSGNVLDCPVKGRDNTSVTLDCGIAFHSVKLSSIMKNAGKASLILCTIGPDLTIETARLTKEGEMTRAVILDAVGSEAVESFADYITGVLKRENMLFNLKNTMRFSPGYGDLNTDVHPAMLRLLDAGSLGVSFHEESFVLVPEKTVTAVIGWI